MECKKICQNRKEKCSSSENSPIGLLSRIIFRFLLFSTLIEDQLPARGDPELFSLRIQVVHLHIPARLKSERSLDSAALQPTPGSLCVCWKSGAWRGGAQRGADLRSSAGVCEISRSINRNRGFIPPPQTPLQPHAPGARPYYRKGCIT